VIRDGSLRVAICFDFYGYDIVRIPANVYAAVSYRGDFLAYRRDNHTLSKVTEQDLEDNALPEHQTKLK
jgi:hypothetical protein